MHRMQIRVVLGLLIMSVGVFAVGCGRGDRPEMADVSGKLTLDGKPLPGYIVTFQPISGRPSVSNMPTNAEGQYELWYTFRDKGAKVDIHKVTLAYALADENAAMEAKSSRATGDIKKILDRYGSAETTQLVFDVTEDTTEANFDITLD